MCSVLRLWLNGKPFCYILWIFNKKVEHTKKKTTEIFNMAVKAKKRNFIQAYFSNFGVRQICDFLMLGGAIVLLVGIFVSNIVIAVGLGIYIVATLLALYRSVRVLCSKINRRSPEYKNAIINTVIMGLIFALALFGFIYALV